MFRNISEISHKSTEICNAFSRAATQHLEITPQRNLETNATVGLVECNEEIANMLVNLHGRSPKIPRNESQEMNLNEFDTIENLIKETFLI